MPANNFDIQGLTDEQVIAARNEHGLNKLNYKKDDTILDTVKRIIKDPMLIMLLVASSIYFISGKTGDGIFLAAAIVFQTSISLYQYSRSRNALAKLSDLSQPHSKVIRQGQELAIKSEEIVIGDSLIIEEGSSVSADGIIVHSNDFAVNESILTGEAFAVARNTEAALAAVSKGTQVVSGLAVYRVTAVGKGTQLGKISTSLAAIEVPPTPLQQQITRFVRNMAIVGVAVFLAVWAVAYLRSGSCWTACSPASRWPCPSCRKRSPWPSRPSSRSVRGAWPNKASS